MTRVIKDGFIFKKSRRKNKKYDVFTLDNKYIVSFGDKRYQQYKDKIGLYSHLNHGDKKRRDNYYKRHGDYRAKDVGKSAKYFSHKYLW